MAIGENIMDSIIKDIRYGFRSLLEAPGFTLIAIGCARARHRR
jgi:hypothetical protein